MRYRDSHDAGSVRRTWRGVGALVAAAALLITAACGGGDDGDSGDDGSSTPSEIKLAFIGPMTGPAGVYGQDQFKGLELAVEQINAAGGVADGPLKGATLSIESHDNAADTSQAAAVAQKLCGDESIPATFGDTISSSTLTELPIFTRCSMPLIDSYSSNPAMDGEKFPTFYRTILSDSDNGAQMARFAVENLGMKRMGLIVAPNDYGAGLNEVFIKTAEELGATIADSLTTSANQKDFSSTITKLRSQDVDGVVMLNEYQDQGVQLKQMHQAGWEVPVLTSTGGNTPALVELAGADATEGVYVAAIFDVNNPAPEIQKFASEYEAKFGGPPGEGSAVAYESVFVLAKALEGAQEATREEVLKGLENLGTIDLPMSGQFAFDELHQPAQVPGGKLGFLLQIQDGEFKAIE